MSARIANFDPLVSFLLQRWSPQMKDMFQAKNRKADSELELEYQDMMGQAIAESGFQKVELSTHGFMHELLHTVPEAVKKSAHYAQDRTSTSDSNESLEVVYEFQARYVQFPRN